MTRLAALLLVASCAHHSAPATAPATPAPQPTHPIDAERLEDEPGGSGALTGDAPLVKVTGDVISAFSCRPNGSSPSLVADDTHVYVVFAETRLEMPSQPGGAPMATPSTYCSYQRFRIPAGLTYGGQR